MPTYDYKCLDCNYTFEEFQKMTDNHLEVCSECGGNLKRLIGTGATPIFKGSGFYQTDYKDSNKKPASTDKPKTSNKKMTADKKVKTEKKSA